MLVVSSREFRANQKNYLDMVDAGQELLIHRGKNRSYRIVPVSEEDVLVSREYLMEPDAEYARANFMKGSSNECDFCPGSFKLF